MANNDTKTCIVCKHEKSVSKFNKNKNHEDGLSKFCRECCKASNKKYYESNKRKSHDRRNELRKKQRLLCKKLVWDFLKEHPCVDCGEIDPVVLEFDHVKGIKSYNIGNMKAQGYALVSLMDEISKCVIRCANCHKRKTAKEQGWWKLESEDKENKVVLEHEIPSLLNTHGWTCTDGLWRTEKHGLKRHTKHGLTMREAASIEMISYK